MSKKVFSYASEKVRANLRKFDNPVQGYIGTLIITGEAISAPINIKSKEVFNYILIRLERAREDRKGDIAAKCDGWLLNLMREEHAKRWKVKK